MTDKTEEIWSVDPVKFAVSSIIPASIIGLVFGFVYTVGRLLAETLFG